jgi:hypothetical protein
VIREVSLENVKEKEVPVELVKVKEVYITK